VALLIFGTSFMVAHYLSDSLDSEYQEFAINENSQENNLNETYAKAIEDDATDELSLVVSGIKKIEEQKPAEIIIHRDTSENAENSNKNLKQKVIESEVRSAKSLIENDADSNKLRKSIVPQKKKTVFIKKKIKKSPAGASLKKKTSKVKISKTIEVLAPEMKIYSGPFDNSESIGVVKKGRKLKVIGRFRNWVWVKDSSLGRGWVHSRMMKAKSI
jgi:flagellar biosynthesis GTPase FlhF